MYPFCSAEIRPKSRSPTLGVAPTEPQSGFVSQKRAKPSGFAKRCSCRGVKLSHGRCRFRTGPNWPCGRSDSASLACPVSSNAMTASSAKRKHVTRNRTSISSPVSLVALPARRRLIPGRLFPRPLAGAWIFWPYVLGLRAHRLPSPKREKMV